MLRVTYLLLLFANFHSLHILQAFSHFPFTRVASHLTTGLLDPTASIA